MWISRKEYKKLTDEKQYYADLASRRDMGYREIISRFNILSHDYTITNQKFEQLKIRYADEVKKNFELASYLSENKSK